jgi:pimeloyl-ACP methyl ester carboxylesterase
VDRPGIGWSSPQPERTLLDHPKDLEQLAKHLELNKYSILVRAASYLIPKICLGLFAHGTAYRQYPGAVHMHLLARWHYLAKGSNVFR